MEKIIHKSANRGFADHGWLKAAHSFSFANFYDENKIHFGKLRVLNDDIVAPSRGFGMHPHQDMEIITIPLSGALKHTDNMENEAIITTGEVQVMSAGNGVYFMVTEGSVIIEETELGKRDAAGFWSFSKPLKIHFKQQTSLLAIEVPVN